MSTIVLSPYSQEWPKIFAYEHERLVRAFDSIAVMVEHIGSTAVPTLTAKTIIDILLGATSLAAIESRIDQLGTIGYEYITKYERELPLRRYFVKSSSTRVHQPRHGTVFHSDRGIEFMATDFKRQLQRAGFVQCSRRTGPDA